MYEMRTCVISHSYNDDGAQCKKKYVEINLLVVQWMTYDKEDGILPIALLACCILLLPLYIHYYYNSIITCFFRLRLVIHYYHYDYFFYCYYYIVFHLCIGSRKPTRSSLSYIHYVLTTICLPRANYTVVGRAGGGQHSPICCHNLAYF